jgi:uncharacterized protein
MNLKKSGVLFTLLLMCAVWLGAAEAIEKKSSVDEIYQFIRKAGPRYTYKTQVVNFQNKGMNMVCTLVIPNTPHKPAIAITMNGFGEDRFYKVVPGTGGEYYYDRLSRILAEQGIATMRVDYRGSGASDGTFDFISFSTQVEDIIAAIDYVHKNLKHEVDINRLGLVGHSQGGLVASVTASRNKRVKSVTVWSAVANPPITYGELITKQGLLDGLNLPDGGKVTVPIYILGYYYGSFDLGKKFFQEIFSTDPLAEIRNYKGPYMYIGGLQDILVWPQPYCGELYMKYHDGVEKLIMQDTDHEFNSDYYPEDFDKTLYWTAAWFIGTL